MDHKKQGEPEEDTSSNDVEARLAAMNESELRAALGEILWAVHYDDSKRMKMALKTWGLEK